MKNTPKNEIGTIRSYIDLIEKNKTNNFINKITKAKFYKKKLQDFNKEIEADETGDFFNNDKGTDKQYMRGFVKNLNRRD